MPTVLKTQWQGNRQLNTNGQNLDTSPRGHTNGSEHHRPSGKAQPCERPTRTILTLPSAGEDADPQGPPLAAGGDATWPSVWRTD